VDNFVDTLPPSGCEARKIKGLAGLPAKRAFRESLMNQPLAIAIGFVAAIARKRA
jgi:hypothetical protein